MPKGRATPGASALVSSACLRETAFVATKGWSSRTESASTASRLSSFTGSSLIVIFFSLPEKRPSAQSRFCILYFLYPSGQSSSVQYTV